MVTIEEIYNIDNTDIYIFDHYKQEEPIGKVIYWGELSPLRTNLSINNTRVLNGLEIVKEELKERDLYLVSKYFQYGDYDSSCMVERSNYKLFMEQYKEESFIYDMSGGYGSTGIAISIKGLLNPVNEETAQEIIDLLTGLNDYPVIDDEDMSIMEYEAFLEALDSWCIRECNDLLSSIYLVEVYEYDEDKLKEVLLESDRNLNYPAYEIECGGGCYIDTKRLIEKVSLSDYFSCLIDFELKGEI